MKREPFTIRLTYESPGITQPVFLSIDPGRTNIGLAAVRADGTTLFAAKVTTRNKEVPKRMKKRKAHRMAHRSDGRRKVRRRRAKAAGTTVTGGSIERHLPGYGEDSATTCKDIRNKEARYCNRKRPEGWLTPTANHLLQTHVNLVKKVQTFLPITNVCLERNKFAFLRLDDPTIKGKAFQNGPLKGYDGQVEAAVYDHQEGRCLLCADPIEEYHHVVARKKNGSETIRNRVGLCKKCHRLVHMDEDAAKELAKKSQGQWKRYDALGVLNQIIPALLRALEPFGLIITTGLATYQFRKEHGLWKDHPIDAYAIACSALEAFHLDAPTDWYEIRQFRRHDRQIVHRAMTDRYYMSEGKVVAINRHKAMDQKKASLEEYQGRKDQLTVKRIKEQRKDPDRVMPGATTAFGVILKQASDYYYFDSGMRKVKQKVRIQQHNEGLVFVSNVGK